MESSSSRRGNTHSNLSLPPGPGRPCASSSRSCASIPGLSLQTSTKPDLYEYSVAARRSRGPVIALDPEHLCPAAEPLRWSPVSGCGDSVVAERRARALVAAAGEANDMRSGAFFRRSATAVLSAYLHAAALDDLSMRAVISWVARPQDRAPLQILSSLGDGLVDWGARLFAHTSGAAETTSGVMRTVDLALGCFTDPAVLEQCSVSTKASFDIGEFIEANGTVFALGKDRGAGGVAPLVTSFCDEFITTAETLAAMRPARRLDPPLLACLDEAPSIVPLPGIPALLADARGRGIVPIIAMQSFSQAEARWGREGAATIRNAASILAAFGGLSVAADLDELSRLAGSRQVARETHSLDPEGRRSTSSHTADESVLAASAIRALREGTALLFWGRLPPLLTHLPGTWESEDAALIAIDEEQARLANDAARREEVTK